MSSRSGSTRRVGRALLWPLVVLGIVSLLVWLRTDDLRLYGWVQFFPCVVLPLIFWLFAPKYTGTWYWFAARGLVPARQAAGALRRGDLFGATCQRHGRHALKHVAAAGACYAILRAFQTREAIMRRRRAGLAPSSFRRGAGSARA